MDYNKNATAFQGLSVYWSSSEGLSCHKNIAVDPASLFHHPSMCCHVFRRLKTTVHVAQFVHPQLFHQKPFTANDSFYCHCLFFLIFFFLLIVFAKPLVAVSLVDFVFLFA